MSNCDDNDDKLQSSCPRTCIVNKCSHSSSLQKQEWVITHPARHMSLIYNFSVWTTSLSSRERQVSRTRNGHPCFRLTTSSCDQPVRPTASGRQLEAEMPTPCWQTVPGHNESLFLLATQGGGGVIATPASNIKLSSWQCIVIAMALWHSSREPGALCAAAKSNISLWALT